jgi:hypothetical protein
VAPQSWNHFTTVDLPAAALPVTATFSKGGEWGMENGEWANDQQGSWRG